MRHFARWGLAILCVGFSVPLSATELDQIVDRENKSAGIKLAAAPVVGDHVFLRRIYVDLIGRIPTAAEVQEFASWPAQGRREKLVDKLIADERFADRWTIFYADMLRLRSNATGGPALIAYVHNAVKTGMPYDEMCRRLIYTNGKANRVPEAGFILGDDADPLAMASITSQVFMGVRIGCAQCHDHPFDVWKRRDFYDMAAYFGKTRRYESQLTRVVYATEADQNTILWPPEGEGADADRKPIPPKFPFGLSAFEKQPQYMARLENVRKAKEEAKAKPLAKGPSVDDLLNDTADKVAKTASGKLPEGGVTAEAKAEIRKIDPSAGGFKSSELREQLAKQVTDPRNRYFSRALVNRVWKTLVGRGFVEPVDDFRTDNLAAHPQTLDYLADEFVASDYDLRTVVKLVVISDAYQRDHAPEATDEPTRQEMEVALLATPMRRMIAESLYDSVVTAGHLFEPKHSPGKNTKVLTEIVRVPKTGVGKPAELLKIAGKPAMKGMEGKEKMAAAVGSYALEEAIELDFTALLKASDDEPEVDEMKVISKEELEAQRMTQERMMRTKMEYVEQTVTRTIDDNPVFNTSLRMQSPAPEGHFLRVFGQPNRNDLGDLRDDSASMRQALMMLNGRVSHEAARVGDLEPIANFVHGKDANPEEAVKFAYLEILTRKPSAEEIKEGKEIIAAATSTPDGVADLRWILLNCNEFRFLP
ncbi:MAG: DUF1553 domain-containing protein [Pirellulaceae bacterium]